jgi:hypothetical protein
MTATATRSEIRSPHNGRVPNLDSPAVSTRARARIPVTKSDRKLSRVRVSGLLGSARTGARRWWVWTSRPSSLRAAWRLSQVDEKRIPGKSGALRTLWKISNWSDRLVLFGLVMLAPTWGSGPLRWIAARPTRRWGFYIVLAAGAVVYLNGRS